MYDQKWMKYFWSNTATSKEEKWLFWPTWCRLHVSKTLMKSKNPNKILIDFVSNNFNAVNTVELLMASKYDIRNAIIIKVISRCDCESLMNYHKTIESMQNIGSPSVLNSLLHPTTLGLLTPRDQCHNQCSFGKTKQCINPLSTQQYEVFWRAYNNILDTIISPRLNKVFTTVINGCPGSGKSVILLELLIALSCTQSTKKQTKILVTAGTDDEVDILAVELHKIRQLRPGNNKWIRKKENSNLLGIAIIIINWFKFRLDLADKLNFIRYGEISRNYRELTLLGQYSPSTIAKDSKVYQQIVGSANIIFCHPRYMYKLQKK